PHHTRQTLGKPHRDPVVAAYDAVAGKVTEARSAFREHRRVLILELVSGGDSQPRSDHGPGTWRRHEALERIRDRAGAGVAQRGVRGNLLVARDRRPAPGLAVAVERALLEELEAEPRGGLPQYLVAGEHELRAELHHRAVVEPRGMDASADAVACFEDDHL